MNHHKLRFVGALFLTLWLLAAAAILLPARTVSPGENRYLTQRPELTLERVISGQFQSELDSFLSDQIPFRTGWIRLHTGLLKAMGRREIGGVYLGDDHRYFQKFTDDSYSAGRMLGSFRMLESVLQELKLPARVMLVPSPGTILREQLPAHAPYYDEAPVYAAAEQLLSCPVLDLREAFRNSDADLYYHTDHHWTTAGAELAYREFSRASERVPRERPLQTVSDSFRGTLDSRVLEFGAATDSIQALPVPEGLTVTFDDGRRTDSPYAPEKLAEKDQYAYFFGGNYGQVTVETGVRNGRKLLILKDSFANAFVPFLLEDYEKIVLVDLRYFGGSVPETVSREEINELLVLYETSNFLTDTGIYRLKR